MTELIQIYVDLLKWDIAILSQWWLYVWVLPILVFVPFFLMKWALLTAPIWLPVGIIYSAKK